MTVPRYSVLLIGDAARRNWLRQLLPSGAMVVEAEAPAAQRKLAAVTFDLVLADTGDSALMAQTEAQLAWRREYSDVPRFYFVERGSVAPQIARRVFVLEHPVSELSLRASLTRMIDRKISAAANPPDSFATA